MSSSPTEVIIYLLLTLGFAVFMFWAVYSNFVSDAPFLLDVPEIDKDQPLTQAERFVHALRWVLFAVIWLLILILAVVVVLLVAERLSGSGISIENNLGLGILGAVIIAWIVILVKHVSLRWPLTIVGALLLTPLSLVFSIGIWKLIIMSAGKKHIFKPSRLRSGTIKTRPRGMVEVYGDD